jgi:hypothetical protein
MIHFKGSDHVHFGDLGYFIRRELFLSRAFNYFDTFDVVAGLTINITL